MVVHSFDPRKQKQVEEDLCAFKASLATQSSGQPGLHAEILAKIKKKRQREQQPKNTDERYNVQQKPHTWVYILFDSYMKCESIIVV